jgi:hypothetical protein
MKVIPHTRRWRLYHTHVDEGYTTHTSMKVIPHTRRWRLYHTHADEGYTTQTSMKVIPHTRRTYWTRYLRLYVILMQKDTQHGLIRRPQHGLIRRPCDRKKHLSSSPVFSGVRVTRSLVLCVCFVDRC